jgi:hypothetical protein
MKVVALIACFVVAASAVSQSFNNGLTGFANLGYPNKASADKGGADSIWGAFAVGTNVRPGIVPNDGYAACMLVMATLNSPLADSTASFCAQPYTGTPADPSAGAGTTCQNIFTLNNKNTANSNMGIFDITPRVNGTGNTYTWPDGIAVGATVSKCTTCKSTSDWQVTALVGYTAYQCTSDNIAFTHWAPVVAIDGPNTWTFTVGSTGYPGLYGVPRYVMLDSTKQGSLPVFALATPDKTGSMHIVFQTAANSVKPYPDLTNSPNWPSDPNLQTFSKQDTTTGPLVAQLGTATTGSFRTGSVGLTPAAAGSSWFVAPYVDSGTSWTIAIGYGHEPSSAMAAAPSILLAAIFAAIAMLL